MVEMTWQEAADRLGITLGELLDGQPRSFVHDGSVFWVCVYADGAAPVLAEPKKSALTGYERQKRWRKKNRDRYNEYMKAYRKRKKETGDE